MKKQFADYTWLAGNHGGKGSLWQGPDHLLVVEAKGLVMALSEVYRRLDYKNVQALTLTETKRYTWMGLLLGLGALIFGVLTWATRDQEVFIPLSLGLPAVLLVILLTVHLARGRTCACTLQTAVQVLRLKPLTRVQTAQPVIERLEALCMEHQKGLAVVEMGAAAAAAAAAAGHMAPFAPRYASAAGLKPRWAGGTWVLLAGLLSVGWALALAGELFVDGLFFTVISMLVGGASAVIAIIALVRANQFKIPGALAGSLWGGLGMHLVAAVALFAVAVTATANSVTKRSALEIIERNEHAAEDLFGYLAAARFEEAGAFGWALLALALMLATCGVIQLVHAPRRKGGADELVTKAPPAAPPPMS